MSSLTVHPRSAVVGIEPLEHRVLMAAQPQLYEPGSTVRGQAQAEWSAAWWQWAISFPASESPVTDTTGEHAHLGDVGKVFFLTGGTDVERDVTVPTGTPLFFPLLTVEGSEAEGNGSTFEELDGYTDLIMSTAEDLFLTVDGAAAPDLEARREESPLFEFTLPPDNFLGVPVPPEGTTSPSVSDGFWAMLKPLRPGEHTIHFGGTFDLTELDPTLGAFTIDTTYHVNVVPRGQYRRDPAPAPAAKTRFSAIAIRGATRVADEVLSGRVAGGAAAELLV